MKKLEFEVPIYTYQIDFAGHVSNIVYVQWMEIGRLKFLEAVGMPIDQITDGGIVPVLMSTEIVYKQPLFLSDRVSVELWLSELRHASARMEFRFYKNRDILAASGSQRGLFVCVDTMRPYRLPRGRRAAFEPFLWDERAQNGLA